MTGLVVALLLRLSPAASAYAAAELTGQPVSVAERLVGICWRESRCTAIGVHERDAHISRRSWRGQVRLGHLDPECQPQGPGWSTRGAWGLNAAAHWRYLPACYAPEVLDVPLLSAIVAARKWRKRCRGPDRARWCRAKRRRITAAR